MPFLSDAGVGIRVAEPVAAAEHDSEEDRLMDPDDARDYADQFPYPDDPGSPGSINDENLEILAAILKQIPECNAMHRQSKFRPFVRPSSTYGTSSSCHEYSARSDSCDLLKEIVV